MAKKVTVAATRKVEAPAKLEDQLKASVAALEPVPAPVEADPTLVDYARSLTNASTEIVMQHLDLYRGTARAPVAGSGAAPACSARVSKPGSLYPGMVVGRPGCCVDALCAMFFQPHEVKCSQPTRGDSP